MTSESIHAVGEEINASFIGRMNISLGVNKNVREITE